METTELLVTVIGWSLAVLSSFVAVPQLTRLLRRKTSEGVSLVSTLSATATMWAWCCYTWVERDTPAFASSVGPLAVWGVVAGIVVVRRRDRISCLLALLALVFMVVTLLSGYAMHIATVGSVVWIIPQGVHALRSEHLVGVSSVAYLLIFVENIGWLAYGVGVGRYAYAAAPIVQMPMSVAIALRSRRHAARTGTYDTTDVAAGSAYPATLP